MAERRPGRVPAFAAPLGVALFWIGVLVGGALAPGYSARSDYISSLASRGSAVAPIGMAAIAAMAFAHLFGAADAWRAWRHRAVAAALALAGVSQLVIAASRIRCPLGAAGCRFEAQPVAQDAFDALHHDAVLAYELFLLMAMLVLFVGAWRAAPWPRWLGIVSLPLGIASAYLLYRTGAVDNGLWQRSWALVSSAWLLLVVWSAWRSARRGG
ncbi:MAG: DUF998 domain-containing protein [Ardenticatenales bacterium]